MTLPIRTLPIVERWDCHGCGQCCWGTIIRLSDDDLRKIRDQAWDKHPDYRGVRVVRKRGFWKKHYRLAHRRDGHCVFLTSEGRCLIHQEHGLDAKPLLCQMFPLQLVPLDNFAYLTSRRNCPSAAADHGRELKEHVAAARRLAEQGHLAAKAAGPPPITPGQSRSWADTLRVTDALERLMLDRRYPPVRRLVHGLQFCRMLQMCRLGPLDGQRFASLLSMLEASAVEESADVFRNRRPPSRAAAAVFRQIAFEYVRLDKGFVAEKSWRERLRVFRDAIAFTRGKGRVFRRHGGLPQTTFEELERPLGHLGAEILAPIGAYFEAAAVSKQYALLGRRRWAIVDSFRALAMAMPIAMWMLRLHRGGQPPGVEDVVKVVGVIERGQTSASLCGQRHRRRLRILARTGQMARLAAWYAR